MEPKYIAVADSGNHIEDFRKFMAATTDALNRDAKSRKEYFRTRAGEKLEKDVIEAMKSKAADYNFSPDKIIQAEKQHFPDIISNHYFGVEVKSTQSNHWKSIGSSIVESLRPDYVKKVFLMFGKLPLNADCEFMCKPYESCLYDISITHSPRYQIDMNTPQGQTIFDKLGEKYDDFRVDHNQINVIRNYYRQYYKEKGEMPWWIEDNEDLTDNTVNNYLNNRNGVRFWNDIDDENIKNFLIESMFQLFPEVIKGKCGTKYKDASLWLASRYSLINPSFRDIFSASGQGRFFLAAYGDWIDNVPKVLCVFLRHYRNLISSFENKGLSYEEIPIYSGYYKKGVDIKRVWVEKVRGYWDAQIPDSFDKLTNMKIISDQNIRVEETGKKAKYLLELVLL